VHTRPARAERRWHAGLLGALCILLLLAGCAQNVKRVNEVPAERAESELPPEALIDVNIAVFDTGLPQAEQADPPENVFPEIRRAEARHIPVTLRDTLERTGYWGAVRVVPEPIDWSELQISGTILHSDGDALVLRVRAEDARGRAWFERTYSEQAARVLYDGGPVAEDPFQDLYNRIANDLLEVRRQLDADELRNIRQVAELRFGNELAPESYGNFLEAENGRFQVVGLPAEGDPMVDRVAAIRERDYRLIDALDMHYRQFQQQVAAPYDQWRAATYNEIQELRELRRQSLWQRLIGAAAVVGGIVAGSQAETRVGADMATAAVIGGVLVFQSGMAKSQEARMHAQAVRELGQSLERDVAPRVVELEGKTVTLSGSAEAQYEEWRGLLRELYAAETGFVQPSDTGEGDDGRL
jgi:hypothetical protein